jgi:GxxExxY protein
MLFVDFDQSGAFMTTDILFKDEVFQIVGAAMDVYNHLGNGFLEAVYQEALPIEFEARGVPFKAQLPQQIHYKDRILRQTYIPDFIAYDQIIVELKAIKALGPNEEAQMLNYLKATGFRLGILLNFGAARKLDWMRRVR